MSTQPEDVDFLEKDEKTIAVVDDEAYVVDEDTLQIHKVGESSFLLITLGEAYSVKYDPEGWLFFDDSEDVPQHIQELLEDRGEKFAEADLSGYPVEFTVSYGGRGAVFESAWRNGKIRPSDPVAETLQDELSEVILDMTVDEQGHITITDLEVWPESDSVAVDI